MDYWKVLLKHTQNSVFTDGREQQTNPTFAHGKFKQTNLKLKEKNSLFLFCLKAAVIKLLWLLKTTGYQNCLLHCSDPYVLSLADYVALMNIGFSTKSLALKSGRTKLNPSMCHAST